MWPQMKHSSIASPLSSRRMIHPMPIPVSPSRDQNLHHQFHPQNLQHHPQNLQQHHHHPQSVVNRAAQYTAKYVKPSQPIYRPPSARIGHGNGHDGNVIGERSESPDSHSSSTSTSHSNDLNIKKSVSNVTVCPPLKSALKRSKSFGTHPQHHQESLDHLMALDGVSWENVSQVRRAMESSESLTMTQLMIVVRIVCNKALEKSVNAHPMTSICMTIMDKQRMGRNHLFVESLLNCLREWFNERDKLRVTSGGTRRWTAYISFVAELYLNMRFRSRHNILNDNDEDEDDADDVQIQLSFIDKQRRQFSALLFDSCQTIFSSVNASPAEIECLQSVLRMCGKYLEEDNHSRMKSLINLARDAFLMSQSNGMSHQLTSQKSLLEIIELAASRWQFSQSQLIYYFPYTKME